MEILVSLFLFFLPFQWALSSTEGVDLATVRLVVPILFFSWAAISLKRRRVLLPPFGMTACAFSFLFIASTSFFWAENSAWALRKIIFLITFFPLLLIFFSTFYSAYEKAVHFLVFGATFSALVAIAQFFLQFVFGVEKIFSFWTQTILPFFLGGGFGQAVATYPSLLVNLSGETVLRGSGLFPDPHVAVFYFGMILPFSAALFFRTRDTIFFITTTILFLADLLTFSRGGYVGLAVAGSVLLGMGARKLLSATLKKQRKKIFLSLGILMTVFLIALISPVGGRFLSSFSSEDGSKNERLRLWNEAAYAIAKHPILGVGIGNYPLFVKPSAQYREPIYAHNLYLDVAAEIGVPGSLFFIGMIALALVFSWRFWKRFGDVFSLATFFSLVIFCGHSFFETPLFSVHILPLWLFVLALSSVFGVRLQTNL